MLEKKDRTTNYYTKKGVQKYMPKNSKESEIIESKCDMKLTHHCLICGSTNSGKSNTLIEFITRTNGCWDKIVLVCQKEEPFNKMLKEELEDNLMVYIGDKGLKDLPDVGDLPEVSEKNNKYILLIFDDCISENKWTDKINRYFKFGRNKGIHILFLSQSYKAGGTMMSFIRKQCSYIILCGIKSNTELKDICNDYSMGDITSEQMLKMYKYCKEDEDNGAIDFMKITTFNCKLNKKISFNFLDHLDPKDFPVDDKKKKTNKSKSIINDEDNEDD